MLVDLRVRFDVREWTPQHKEVHRQGAGGFRLQNELIGDIPLTRLVRVTLAFVDDRLDHPLVVERGESGSLVVQTVYVLIGTVWLHLEVIEDNFLVAQEINQREEKLFLLGRPGVVRLQGNHNLSSRFLRMGAVGFVGRDLVRRTAPLASDAGKLALGRSFFALVALVVLDRLIGELVATVLTLTGQLRDCLLHGQVARRSVLADLGATIRAGRVLITQSAIRQQVSETSSTHQMSHGTLIHCSPWQIQTDSTTQNATETGFQLFNHFGHRFIDFLSFCFRLILIRVLGWACDLLRFPNLLLIDRTATIATTAVAQTEIQLLATGHDLLG